MNKNINMENFIRQNEFNEKQLEKSKFGHVYNCNQPQIVSS